VVSARCAELVARAADGHGSRMCSCRASVIWRLPPETTHSHWPWPKRAEITLGAGR
jgi:hypothetical protein